MRAKLLILDTGICKLLFLLDIFIWLKNDQSVTDLAIKGL